MRERNVSIDAVKGLAIILVMIGHVFVHNHMEDPYIYDFIKAVQMPLFIIISGYLCGRGRKITDVKAYGKALGKRAVSYLVPFFCWLTVMHLDELKLAYQIVFFKLDYGLWFLAVLFILTFMVYTAQLAQSIYREKNKVLSELAFWAACSVFWMIIIVQLYRGNTLLSPSLTFIYIPFYMLGYAAGNYSEKFLCWGTNEEGKLDCRNNKQIKAIIIGMTIAFLYLVVTKNLNSMESKMNIIFQMTASLLGSIAMIYGTLLWKDGKLKNIFAKLGEYSLEIYVVHYHFANMLNFYDKQYDFYTLEGAAFVMVSFAAMCAVTFCCIWLMKKVKLIDFLFFGKR